MLNNNASKSFNVSKQKVNIEKNYLCWITIPENI